MAVNMTGSGCDVASQSGNARTPGIKLPLVSVGH